MSVNCPNTYELVESVREMMETRLLPILEDKELIYHCRVAVNILNIVERELQQVDSLNTIERDSLQQLLAAEGEVDGLTCKLIEKIYQGEFDSDNSKLLAHLQRVTVAKIAVDNPQYSTYKRYLHTGKLVNY